MFGELTIVQLKVIFLGDFSFVKIFLTKLSCYHDNYFKYFMFGKHNGFVSKARGFCMYVFSSSTVIPVCNHYLLHYCVIITSSRRLRSHFGLYVCVFVCHNNNSKISNLYNYIIYARYLLGEVCMGVPSS